MKFIHGAAKQKGVTLVELVISIVVLSIAMVAMMNSFSLSMSHSADPLWRNKSLKLAQLYLDEILSKNYDELTPVGGIPVVANPSCASLGSDGVGASAETRATYDDVDDYNGIDDLPPKNLTNSIDSSYALYRVTVEVTCDGDSVGATGGTADNNAKKITVTVTPPDQSPMTFAAYKANY